MITRKVFQEALRKANVPLVSSEKGYTYYANRYPNAKSAADLRLAVEEMRWDAFFVAKHRYRLADSCITCKHRRHWRDEEGLTESVSMCAHPEAVKIWDGLPCLPYGGICDLYEDWRSSGPTRDERDLKYWEAAQE